jgi:hypothetical protein
VSTRTQAGPHACARIAAMEILGAATTILAGLAFLLLVYGNLSYE